MKVVARVDVDFPKLGFALRAGEERELPADKKAQEQILACPEVSKVEDIKK